MRRRTWFGFALASAFTGVLGVAVLACGNGANDVGACQTLESARCERAPECGIDLGFPLHAGSTTQDNITACQLFYQDACLHGFVTTITITAADVSNCLYAIQHDNCNAVLTPQDSPACAWINPPDAGVDAGVDVSTTTADVVTVVVTVDATLNDAPTDVVLSNCDASCESTCSGDPNCIMMCGC